MLVLCLIGDMILQATRRACVAPNVGSVAGGKPPRHRRGIDTDFNGGILRQVLAGRLLNS
jgi:hypothetical protein